MNWEVCGSTVWDLKLSRWEMSQGRLSHPFHFRGNEFCFQCRFSADEKLLCSLCQFEIFQANIINVHFSKASFYLDRVLVFYKSPNGLPLMGACDSLKDALQFKAVWSVSPRTCGHVQLNADSRGESWKLELVSTVSTQHRHSIASNIPAGNSSHTPSVWSVLGANPVVFKYTDGHSEKKQESRWLIFRLWCSRPMDFNLPNQRANMHDGTSI